MKNIYHHILKMFNYSFNSIELLTIALTHSSNPNYKKKSKFNQEKLEFLGDSVLGLAITSILIEIFPNESEGELARRRSFLVSKNTLSDIGRQKNLGTLIDMSNAEKKNYGKINKSNLANVMEALIGAIYIDSNNNIIQIINIIKNIWKEHIEQNKIPPKDAKSNLQEIVHAQKKTLSYKTIDTTGPAHNPIFTIAVKIEDDDIEEVGVAGSKKEAEMLAAIKMLKRIAKDSNQAN